jgi:hypothetical protein
MDSRVRSADGSPRTRLGKTGHVRFGSKADIGRGLIYVRFTPESRHDRA